MYRRHRRRAAWLLQRAFPKAFLLAGDSCQLWDVQAPRAAAAFPPAAVNDKRLSLWQRGGRPFLLGELPLAFRVVAATRRVKCCWPYSHWLTWPSLLEPDAEAIPAARQWLAPSSSTAVIGRSRCCALLFRSAIGRAAPVPAGRRSPAVRRCGESPPTSGCDWPLPVTAASSRLSGPSVPAGSGRRAEGLSLRRPRCGRRAPARRHECRRHRPLVAPPRPAPPGRRPRRGLAPHSAAQPRRRAA